MYVIEFYYQDEVIESREYDAAFMTPHVGDVVNIQFTNPSYKSYGSWWAVQERRILFFLGTPGLLQKLMLNITPDPKNGLLKSDPAYHRFVKD